MDAQKLAVCDEASDGHEAIAKALDHKPDIVILDINMRGLGGFDAAKKIHRVLPDVPILFFTMHGDQFLCEAKRVGAQGFVSKEQGANVLVSAVKALLRGETFFFRT